MRPFLRPIVVELVQGTAELDRNACSRVFSVSRKTRRSCT